MTQEEKQLLLQDLCARLSYGTVCEDIYGNSGLLLNLVPKLNSVTLKISELGSTWTTDIDNIKPYLRPMSSMTEEEERKYNYIKENHTNWEAYDYLNFIHIDYRGLIPKGLALEAPEDMYK